MSRRDTATVHCQLSTVNYISYPLDIFRQLRYNVGNFILAYTVLGLAGLFKGKFVPATIVACVARFLIHYVVGATIWAEYMPDVFFGITMKSPWFYSLLYNLAYMLPNIAITLVVFAVAYKPLKKYLTGEDLLAAK